MTETVSAEPSTRGPIRRLPAWLRLPSWWLPALCLLLGMACGASYGLLKPAQYTATGYVVVSPTKNTDPVAARGLAQAYGRIATSGAVFQDARKTAGVPVATLRSRVQSATSPDAPMIEISATATRADRAAVIANAVAHSLIKAGNDSREATGVRLVLFSKALAPTVPSSPSAYLTAAVGSCAGLLVGALLVLVRPRGGRREILPVPAPAQEPGGSSKAKDLREPKEATEPTKEMEGVR